MGNKNIKKEKIISKKEGKETNDNNESKLKDKYKIVFIGESGTGAKSTLINRLTGIDFNENIITTIYASFINIKIGEEFQKEIILHLWDTAGQEKFRQLNKIFIQNLDCAIIGYDITNRRTFEEVINYWHPLIKNEFKTCNSIYLIGNKIDLIEDRQVTREEAIEFAKKENLRFFEISCKTDEGIKEFFDDVKHYLLKELNQN